MRYPPLTTDDRAAMPRRSARRRSTICSSMFLPRRAQWPDRGLPRASERRSSVIWRRSRGRIARRVTVLFPGSVGATMFPPASILIQRGSF